MSQTRSQHAPPLAASRLGVTLGHARIIHNVSLTVHSGEWLAVIGPNGAGKSTLLKAICELLPHEGQVLLGVKPTQSLTPKQRAQAIAYAPQVPTLPPTMLVHDYVLLGRTPHLGYLGITGPRDSRIADETLERLDLTPFATRGLGSLSGGEQQRVVLARALAQQSPILLLDEPTTALDLGHQQQLMELIDRLRREKNLTVITTLHDLNLASQYADRLLLLAHGAAVADGPPSEVLTTELIATHYGAAIDIHRENGGRPTIHLKRNS